MAMTVTNDAVLTWQWATNYWLETVAAGNGTVDPEDQWVASGHQLGISATPDANHHFTGWTGDIEGCTINGAELTAPMTQARSIMAHFAIDTYTLTYNADAGGVIAGDSPQTVSHGGDGTPVTAVANTGHHFTHWSDGVLTPDREDANVTADLTLTAYFARNPYTLAVASAHGAPDPAIGVHTNLYGSLLTNSVSEIVIQGGTQYVATGWTLDGHDPASGSSNKFAMTVTNDAVLTWQWATNYWLETVAAGNGAVDPEDQWVAAGHQLVISATPDANHHFTGWTGDIEGCTINGAELTAPMTQARSIMAHFAIETYTLTTPTFNPDGGSHPGNSVDVTITCATPDATIRYTSGFGTTPGADPTTSSTVVPANGIVNVPVPGWLKAQAWKDGMTESGVKAAVYHAQGADAVGWRYPRMDRIGHGTLHQGAQGTGGKDLALLRTITDVSSVLTGDVDGDGMLDIVTVSGSTLRIHDETGTLKRTVSLPRDCFLAMLEDADGDGVLDIFLGGSGSGFAAYVYKGNGTHLKTFAGQHAGGNDVSIRPIAVSNGKVLVGYDAGYALTPRGFAAFDYETAEELWYYQVGPSHRGVHSVADMDGNGLLNLLMGSFTPHNRASGNDTTDSDMYVIVVDETGVRKITQKYTSPSKGRATHVFADLTGDGNQEILGFKGHDPTHYPGQSKIQAFGRDGTVLHTFDGPQNESWSYAVGDLDNNGQIEIVAAPVRSTDKVYVLDSSLNLIRQTNVEGRVQLLVDLNGDGFKEIVLLSSTGWITVLDRNLNMLSTLRVGSVGGEVIASDVTGDGRIELLCRTDALYIVGLTDGGSEPCTLGEAVNAPELIWTTGGNANWFFQEDVTRDGLVAQSGAITHNQQSLMQTTVTGPGMISFWWKVSSEANWDFLRFYIGNTEQQRISGNVDWQQRSFTVPPGTHTLKWQYDKDGSITHGSDAGWVDQVVWEPIRCYFYRISSSAPTTILSVGPDGTLVWSNSNLGASGRIQRATAIDSETWEDIHEFTASEPVMSRNVHDLEP